MAPAPVGEAAVRLWDAIQVISREPGFFEITRPAHGRADRAQLTAPAATRLVEQAADPVVERDLRAPSPAAGPRPSTAAASPAAGRRGRPTRASTVSPVDRLEAAPRGRAASGSRRRTRRRSRPESPAAVASSALTASSTCSRSMSCVPSVICSCGSLARGAQQDRQQLGPRVAGAVGVGELERDDREARDLLVEAQHVGERLLHRRVERHRAVGAGVVVLPHGPGVHERAAAGLAHRLGERGAEPDVGGRPSARCRRERGRPGTRWPGGSRPSGAMSPTSAMRSSIGSGIGWTCTPSGSDAPRIADERVDASSRRRPAGATRWPPTNPVAPVTSARPGDVDRPQASPDRTRTRSQTPDPCVCAEPFAEDRNRTNGGGVRGWGGAGRERARSGGPGRGGRRGRRARARRRRGSGRRSRACGSCPSARRR